MGVSLLSANSTYTSFIDVLPAFEFNFLTGSYQSNTGAYLQCGRTTTARYTDANGATQTAAPGVVRFKRDPISGAILGLLSEPSATNLSTYNNDLTQSSYTKNNSAVTLSSTVFGTDGIGMFHLTENTTSNTYHGIDCTTYQNVDANGWFSGAIYAKAGERNYIDVELGFKPQSTGFKVTVSLIDGSWSLTSGSVVPGNVNVVAHKNGIFRIELTAQASTTTSTARLSFLTSNGASVTYAGTVGYGVYVQYPQMEASPRCTSTIITNATSVTRDNDNYYVPSSSLTGLLNPLNYTLYAEATPTLTYSNTYFAGDVSPTAVALCDSTISGGNGVIGSLGRLTSALVPYMFSRGSSYLTVSGMGAWTSGVKKLAMNSSGTFAYAGTAITQTGFTPNNSNTLQIGSALSNKEYFEGYVSIVRLYNQSLPTSTMQVITTP